MSLAKKIARRYIASIDLSKVTFEKHSDQDRHGNLVTILLKVNNTEFGAVDGYYNTYKRIENFHCYSDIQNLVEIYPQVLEKDLSVRIAEVDNSNLHDEVQGKGFGVKIYLEYARGQWEDNGGKPFILIPQECNDIGGSTSDKAFRVWKSLARKYPSSGDCVVILNRP